MPRHVPLSFALDFSLIDAKVATGMLLSLALIFLCGMTMGALFERIKLPRLIGMLLVGILLGPYALQLLDASILSIAPDLRRIALIIILTRAGLNLNLADLKKIGRPAILLCFLPSCFEIVGALLLAPPLLHVTLLEAAMLGAVLAAVSPAVIVPRMLKLMEEGYGSEHAIPQMMMAGASVDNAFVIVLFTSFTGLTGGEGLALARFASIPTAIVLGVLLGAICGKALAALFRRVHMRDSAKVLTILSISFLFLVLQDQLNGIVGFSGLIAVIVSGISLRKNISVVAERLSKKYDKLWVAAELLLFVLVGASVDVGYAIDAGLGTLLLIVSALLFRMLGVWVCLIKTKLSRQESLFCMLAYCPKATVQAAIGAIPLTMGLPCGKLVLSVAVLAIVVTAPVGAFAIDKLYPRLLRRTPAKET